MTTITYYNDSESNKQTGAAAEGAAAATAEGGAAAVAEGGAAVAEAGADAAATSPAIFNPVFEDAGALGVDATEDTSAVGEGLSEEEDLFEDNFGDITQSDEGDLPGKGKTFANPSLEGPVEDATETAKEVKEEASRFQKVLDKIKNAPSKTLELAGKGVKNLGVLAKKAFKNPLKAFIVRMLLFGVDGLCSHKYCRYTSLAKAPSMTLLMPSAKQQTTTIQM